MAAKKASGSAVTRKQPQASNPGPTKSSTLPGAGADPATPEVTDPPQGRPGGVVARKRGASVKNVGASKATKARTSIRKGSMGNQATPRQAQMNDLSQTTSTRQRAASALPPSARTTKQANMAAARKAAGRG